MKIKVNGQDISADSSKESLLDVVEVDNDYGLDYPCGGNGSCGGCMVNVENATLAPSEVEEDFTGSSEPNGERLACQVQLEDGLSIDFE